MSTSTDRSEDMRNWVANTKRLLGLDINRLAIGSEIEGLIIPVEFGGFGGADDYTITGMAGIDFCNVNTSIVTGTQTGT